jgi:hypothetical protein
MTSEGDDMADVAEIRNLMKLDAQELERRLAIEYSVTEKIDVTAMNIDPKELAQRMQRAIARMRQRIDDAIRAAHTKLHEVACKRLGYCKNRDSATEVLITGLVDARIIELTAIPLPIAGICVYIVKHRMLDVVCDC